MRVYKSHHVFTTWIVVGFLSAAWGAGDHTDIERRMKITLSSLPGPLSLTQLPPAAPNTVLAGPAIAGPNASPTYRPLVLNDIPPGSPPGPHGSTHESGGIDQLSVNAPTAPNRMYASPASGMAGAPAYRSIVLEDLPTISANQIYAAPPAGGAPVYRPAAPADFGPVPANTVLVGPSSGGAAAPSYRALVPADVSGAAASVTHASTHLYMGSDAVLGDDLTAFEALSGTGGAVFRIGAGNLQVRSFVAGTGTTVMNGTGGGNVSVNVSYGTSSSTATVGNDGRICAVTTNSLHMGNGSTCALLAAPTVAGQVPVYGGSSIAWAGVPVARVHGWVLSPNSLCYMSAPGVTCLVGSAYSLYVSDGVRTVKNLRCKANSNYSGGSVTFVVQKNGGIDGATCTMSSTSTTCTDTSTLLTLAQYDTVDMYNSAVGGPWTNRSATCTADIF